MAHQQSAEEGPLRSSGIIVPIIVGGSLFMQMLDSTIVASTLPAMAVSFNKSTTQLGAVITSYLLGSALLLPLSGWMASRFGEKKVFLLALTSFTIASISCGLSLSFTALILSRFLQGSAGALMVPVGRIMLLKSAKRDEIASITSFLTIPAIIGPILGPPVGGFFVTVFDWRSVFWINIPFGVMFIVLSVFSIRRSVTRKNWFPLDIRGFLLSGLGLASIMTGLESVGKGPSSFIYLSTLLVFGSISLSLYVLHFKRASNPIIRLDLLLIRTFSTSTIGGGLCRLGFGSIPFLLVILLQERFGINPFIAGLIMLSSAVGALLNKPFIMRLLRKFSFKEIIVTASLLHALTLVFYGCFQVHTSHAIIVALLLTGGFVRSTLFTTLNTLAYADIAHDDLGAATSLSTLLQQLSFSTGVALSAFIISITSGPLIWWPDSSGGISTSFILLAGLSLCSLPWFLSLPKDAGEVLRSSPIDRQGRQ